MRSTFDVWSIRTDLFAKTNRQDFYAMIDQLMETMDGLVRKHAGRSKVRHDDRVKTAAGAA